MGVSQEKEKVVARLTVDLDAPAYDDELADFGGVASASVVAVTVASHVAAVTLCHRSADADRTAARIAAAFVLTRLRRRGGAAIAIDLDAWRSRIGRRDFDAALRAAAEAAAGQIRRLTMKPLDSLVGRAGRVELLRLGARACLPTGRLSSDALAFLARHLCGDGDVEVGLGRGRVFARHSGTRPIIRFAAGPTEVRLIASVRTESIVEPPSLSRGE